MFCFVFSFRLNPPVSPAVEEQNRPAAGSLHVRKWGNRNTGLVGNVGIWEIVESANSSVRCGFKPISRIESKGRTG